MSKSKREMTPRQFFMVAIKGLGADVVGDIIGVRGRTINRYAADPLTTDSGSQTPHQLEEFPKLFMRLEEVGRGYAARGLIRFLQAAIDDDVQPPTEISNPLPTIEEEILADYRAVAALQNAIDERQDVDLIGVLKQAAIDEIERTYAKYLQCRDREQE